MSDGELTSESNSVNSILENSYMALNPIIRELGHKLRMNLGGARTTDPENLKIS